MGQVRIRDADLDESETLVTSSAAKCCLLQIFWDSFAKRYGTGTRCIWLLGIPLGACWFCGLLSMTAASRMMYSFSRDGAMPFYRLIRYVDSVTQAPVVAGEVRVPCQHSQGCHRHVLQHMQCPGLASRRVMPYHCTPHHCTPQPYSSSACWLDLWCHQVQSGQWQWPPSSSAQAC